MIRKDFGEIQSHFKTTKKTYLLPQIIKIRKMKLLENKKIKAQNQVNLL